MGTYLKTERTTALRDRGRMNYDADVVHDILDEAYFCHLGFVADGEPRILPTLHVRVDDTLYLHGSTGSRPLLAARHGALRVCVTVTLLDGLVFGRSQFHHSANYRSVVAHGLARLVTDEAEKSRAFTALVDKAAPGRAADSRPPIAKELAQTAVLALTLAEVSAKVRTGGVVDEPEDYGLPHWAGVLPLRLVAGQPIPDEGVSLPVPGYLRTERSPWHTAPTLRGRHVTLEPLDLAHAEGLFAALDDEEVWRHLSRPRPDTPAGMAEDIAAALADPNRVPMLQRSATTGEIIGTTSYYAPDPVHRTIAIGYTAVGRPWWRTAVNTESKLLLLSRAFDELGAMRVEWHTDIRNERSQRAIERLGANREGLLRAHRRRADGTWRDTVLYAMTSTDWPEARVRLTALQDRHS
jgi:RimJ/RimL family protein N-acetyltransferase/nitroimidazol reductase NimA-like FMN-containing flavoprotein (pyridoxamine 5'-phosphate oxidase superfamily)